MVPDRQGLSRRFPLVERGRRVASPACEGGNCDGADARGDEAAHVRKGIHPDANGIDPLLNGIDPFFNSIHPVPDGIPPIPNGIYPIAKGIHPILNGIHPIVDGIRPSLNGTQPFFDFLAKHRLSEVETVVFGRRTSFHPRKPL